MLLFTTQLGAAWVSAWSGCVCTVCSGLCCSISVCGQPAEWQQRRLIINTMLPVTIHYTLYIIHTVHTTQCYQLQYIIHYTLHTTQYTLHNVTTYNTLYLHHTVHTTRYTATQHTTTLAHKHACNGLMKLFCGFYDILSLASNIYKI